MGMFVKVTRAFWVRGPKCSLVSKGSMIFRQNFFPVIFAEKSFTSELIWLVEETVRLEVTLEEILSD